MSRDQRNLMQARQSAIARLKKNNGGCMPSGYTEAFVNTLPLLVAETLGIWEGSWEGTEEYDG